ncbi:hypothetical protein C8J35_103510 [Rhizobium sp. PP-F2F-G38]|nr:hypothetical protein C8J35_103510 [Rhizobium sp. PP-F2F-G38]
MLCLPMPDGAVAGGYFMTGNTLHEFCKTDSPVVLGFVMGVSDLHTLYETSMDSKVSVCFPQGVTGRQEVDVACKYLADNPDVRNQAASGLAIVAFSHAWPCS